MDKSKAATNPGGTPRDTADQVSDEATRLKQQVESKAAETVASAKAGITNKADSLVNDASSEVSGIASALRSAAGELRSGSPQERSFSQIADGLANAADSMKSKDAGELARDASNFARRNPMAFLGGAVLVGFVAARFAKASSEDSSGAATAQHRPNPYGERS